MSDLTADALEEYLGREARLWRGELSLLHRLDEFIFHKLPPDNFVGELQNAREGLKALTTLSKFEDKAIVAAHLIAAHQLIVEVLNESNELAVALQEVIEKPSDISLKRFEKTLESFADAEGEKIKTLTQTVSVMKGSETK